MVDNSDESPIQILPNSERVEVDLIFGGRSDLDQEASFNLADVIHQRLIHDVEALLLDTCDIAHTKSRSVANYQSKYATSVEDGLHLDVGS